MRELIKTGRSLLKMKRSIIKMMEIVREDTIFEELEELNKIVNKILLKVLETISTYFTTTEI